MSDNVLLEKQLNLIMKTVRENLLQTQGLLSSKEAAAYLGISDSSLRQARAKGNTFSGKTPAPPYIRLGEASIKYRRTDLDAWIDNQATLGNYAMHEY